MSQTKPFTIQDEFPPVDYAEWRKVVEADLQGAPFEKKLVTTTYEGIDFQPLYTQADFPSEKDPYGLPGAPPFVRGARPLEERHLGCDLRQEIAHPVLEEAAKAIHADLHGGASSLLLRLDPAAADGWDADHPSAERFPVTHGVMAYSADDFVTLLEGVDFTQNGIALESGAAFLPAAALLAAAWERSDGEKTKVRGAFNADPFAVMAREGQLPYPPDRALAMLADLATWTAENYPQVTAVGVDTAPYHHAGATAVQDLALAMSTAVAYLRAMTEQGMDVDTAARQITFRMSVGTHHFLAVGKLRAARRLWWQVVEACGGSEAAGKMNLHVRTSDRVLTRRDPHVNILRNTAGVFAACVGGADTITSVAFDYALGLSGELSRRVARNTLLIVQEEAHLDQVVDPAGGSWFLDRITEQLAEEAWSIFQRIEQKGGILVALESGRAAEKIEEAYRPRAKDIASRKEGITGVSEFPNLSEQRVATLLIDPQAVRRHAIEHLQSTRDGGPSDVTLGRAESQTAAAVQAALNGATLGQLSHALGFHQSTVSVRPIEVRSFAGPFEQLRDVTDRYEKTHGKRPTVFLANMGPIAHHTARATYSKNFFEAGGFAVVTNDGFQDDAAAAVSAFRESGASVAVICSSDKLYPDIVPQLAPALKEAGARSVVLAGNPGSSEGDYRAAGVDRFIFIKCDVLATLRAMLHEEGVVTE